MPNLWKNKKVCRFVNQRSHNTNNSLKVCMILASEDEEKNTFLDKILESGHKSAMQYWLTRGKPWPSFQKIALR
uniref:Uncharacterized protein n=1 Tax=Romanomermis culicivorax TaxID=13658 RepID=A0A915ITV7_ROMCU